MTIMPDDNNLAYTLSGLGRKRDPYAERRTMAQRLLAQGMDTSPVQSPWQGAARLAQALMGGYDAYAADRDEKKATEDRNSKLAGAIAKMKTDPEGGLAEAASLDPEYGLRAASQLAIEKVKLGQQRDTRQGAADRFGASYGMPGGVSQSALPAPGGYQGALGGFESGNNPKAVNPQSGAGGEFQFMPQTWAEVRAKHPDLQLPATPMEASGPQQAAAEARFRDGNAQTLKAAGIPVTPATLYLAHRTGTQGAQTLIKADPNAPMEAVVPQSWIAQNPDMQGKTVGQFLQMTQARFPGGQQPQQSVNVQASPSGQPGQPQPLTINMGGPGGMPQGSAENVGMPPQPSPQGVQGPTMMAQAPPSVPNVPRPQPTPDQIRRAQQQIMDGVPQSQVAAALNAELDRDWGVQRERAKMQFEQQSQAYTEGRKPTEAQKSVDTNFGKEYAEWVAGGGQADTRRQIVQLEEALGKLKSGKNLTGAFIGNLPDGVLNIFNPEAVSTRNAVEEVVQRNLRLVLGAQFTEKEGERLIARAYNPSQSEEENAKRVGRLLEQIKAGAAAKVSAAQYYEQNGTLRGWSGKLPTLADFDPDARTDRGSPTDIRKKYGLE